jgi:hypothetical protein
MVSALPRRSTTKLGARMGRVTVTRKCAACFDLAVSEFGGLDFSLKLEI